MSVEEDVLAREKLSAIQTALRHNSTYIGLMILLTVGTAALEGFGMGFIIPIIEVARQSGSGDLTRIGEVFSQLFQILNIPFTLEYIIISVSGVILIRWTTAFLVAWLREVVVVRYIRDLRDDAFTSLINAQVSFFDEEGSDEILNAVITQTQFAGRVIRHLIRLVQKTLVSMVYLGLALYLAPLLTVASLGILGILTYVIRFKLQSGYKIGERVADANEKLQKAVQSGAQGIRDVKMFGMKDDLQSTFSKTLGQYADSRIKQRRNAVAIKNSYRASSAIIVFALLYAALTFTNLSFGELGVFLFAMFRLAPAASNLNNIYYSLESALPHLVRMKRFTSNVEAQTEVSAGTEPVPDELDEVRFENVSFSYMPEEQVLKDITFDVRPGEFIAFVGQSGAGKSTIVSLLARMYDPDNGNILANGESIDNFDIDDWRDEVAIVRQDPFIFDESLWYNLTIGADDPTQSEVDEACEIARVSEFFDDLSKGYDTELGENGVQLSGGQRQRVALARALLKDASILVLDEATSDLDTGIEQEVQESIESMDNDYATLAIAHRLSTIIHADRIYTVDSGRIVESGLHEELVEKDGKYAQLYQTQV